ncbi:hypothetical protein [Pseudomonas lopnurensis]|uniref:hypothetical protein n=1 Tax=Pseudomonas lopnurensis TaxID=1477517 RepID=UPI00187933DC|nr:hypothetical protein [Pseudomonas lopnurensis]MBE7375941.1 hypothetical protein [Pseudomonas lopnurensis]
MGDPLERAASKALPIIGSGCTRRYDPEALTPEHGAEFAEAAALWARLQEQEKAEPALPDGHDDDADGRER